MAIDIHGKGGKKPTLNKEETKMIENSSIKKEDLTTSKTKKKFNLDLNSYTPIQKYVAGGVGFVVFISLFTLFTGDNESQARIQKEVFQSVKIQKNTKIDLTKKKAGDAESQDIFDKVNSMQSQLDSLESKKAGYSNAKLDTTVIFKSFIDLSKILVRDKFILEDNTKLNVKYVENSSMLEFVSNGITTKMDETTLIPFKIGYIISSGEGSNVYIVAGDTDKINLQMDIWELSNTSPLKKTISIEDKSQVLQYITDKTSNEEGTVVQKYENQLVLISKTGEVKQVLKYKLGNESFNNNALGETLQSDTILGFMNNDLETIKIDKDGLVRRNGQLEYNDANARYSMKLLKVEDSESKVKINYIAIYKNKILIDHLTLKSIKNVYFKVYKDNENDEFVNENGVIYRLDINGVKIREGKGIIIGKIKNKSVVKTTITLNENKVETFSLKSITLDDNGNQKSITLVGDNGILYRVENNQVEYEGIVEPINVFKLDSAKYLYRNNFKVAKIKKIKINSNVGIEIITKNDYLIKLVSKTKYSITNNKTKEVYFKDEKLDFKINKADNSITISSNEKVNVDKVKKTVNNINYFKLQETDEAYVLYDELGTNFKTIEKAKKVEYLKEKIINMKITKGEMFSLFYTIDTKTGTVKSDEVGEYILKKDTNNSVLKRFNNNLTSRKKFKEKKEKVIKKETISIKEMFANNYNIQNFTFETVDGKKLKIFGQNTIKIDNFNIKIDKASLYNKKRNLFEIKYNDKENYSNAKKLNKKFGEGTINLYIDSIKTKYSNYNVDSKFLFDVKNFRIIKTELGYEKVISENFDMIENKIIVITGKKIYNLEINNMKSINEGVLFSLQKAYSELEKKMEKDDILNSSAVIEEDTETVFQIQKLKKELAEIEKEIASKKNVNMNYVKYSISKVQKEEIKVEDKEIDFTFNLGTIMKFETTSMITLKEGETKFIIVKLKTHSFSDLEGNELSLINPTVKAEVTGDLNTKQIFIKPILISYIDGFDNTAREIIIPSASTILFYKDKEGNNNDGIPGFVVLKEVKNLPTKIVLSTVDSIVQNLTKPQDAFGDLLSGGAGASAGGGTDTQSIGDSTLSGVNSGLQEIKSVIDKQIESDKSLIIIPTKEKFEIQFIDKLEVSFKKGV